MHLRVSNPGTQAAPVGLGWHPYFVKRADARLQFSATGCWEMAPDKLPTHRTPHTGLDQPTADLHIDHCLDGWNGVLRLIDSQFQVALRSTFSRLVVFTTPEREDIALEPVSHVNNALNLLDSSPSSAQSLGVVVLQPGGHCSGSMQVNIQRVKEHYT
jgi:aldose 1-epimerase